MNTDRATSICRKNESIMKRNCFRWILAIVCLSISNALLAYEWETYGTLMTVEASYMPNGIAFQSNSGAGACPAGSWLWYPGQGNTDQDKRDNAKSTLSLLLTATVSGNMVHIFGSNNVAGNLCVIDHIHLTNN